MTAIKIHLNKQPNTTKFRPEDLEIHLPKFKTFVVTINKTNIQLLRIYLSINLNYFIYKQCTSIYSHLNKNLLFFFRKIL